MPDEKTVRILDRIGELLAEDWEYPLDGTLLYAMVHRGFVAPSIYKNLGNHILYREPDLDRLGGALLDLWYAQTAKPYWEEVEYVIRDGRFDCHFVYDKIDPEDASFYRRERVAAKYFGDKPIVYPPMPEHDDAAFDL